MYKKSWNNFTINTPDETKYVDCQSTPYQTIDSGMFYEKILSKLKSNKNIHFFKNIDELDKSNSLYLIVCLILKINRMSCGNIFLELK